MLLFIIWIFCSKNYINKFTHKSAFIEKEQNIELKSCTGQEVGTSIGQGTQFVPSKLCQFLIVQQNFNLRARLLPSSTNLKYLFALHSIQYMNSSKISTMVIEPRFVTSHMASRQQQPKILEHWMYYFYLIDMFCKLCI